MKRFSLMFMILAACATAPTDPAGNRLDTTPRHNEWAQVVRGDRTIHTYVAYPERSSLSPVVLLIHENRGLTDFERSVADRLAENGYIALAPDLLSGMAPNGGRTSDFSGQDAAREAIGRLPHDQVMADLHAVADYAKKIVSANGTLQVAGFCWGGTRTWLFANDRVDLRAAYPFYGTGPDEPAEVANINAPVFGFYGGDDARVNASLPRTEELMRAAGKRFEPVTYEGAGHAFMRAGMAADAKPANKRAHDEAWARWLELLRTNSTAASR